MHAEQLEKGKRREAQAKPDECVSTLDHYSLIRNGEILCLLPVTNSDWGNYRFSDFTVESLHLLHLCISKKLKQYTLGFLLVTDKKFLHSQSNAQ